METRCILSFLEILPVTDWYKRGACLNLHVWWMVISFNSRHTRAIGLFLSQIKAWKIVSTKIFYCYNCQCIASRNLVHLQWWNKSTSWRWQHSCHMLNEGKFHTSSWRLDISEYYCVSTTTKLHYTNNKQPLRDHGVMWLHAGNLRYKMAVQPSPKPKDWVDQGRQWTLSHQYEHKRHFFKKSEERVLVLRPRNLHNCMIVAKTKYSRTVCWFSSQSATPLNHATRRGYIELQHDIWPWQSYFYFSPRLWRYWPCYEQWAILANVSVCLTRVTPPAPAAQPHLPLSINAHPFICRTRNGQDVMHRRRWTEASCSNDKAVSLRGFLESFVVIQVGVASWCL